MRKLQLRKIPLPIKDEVNLFLAYVVIIRSKPCTYNTSLNVQKSSKTFKYVQKRLEEIQVTAKRF